MAFRRSNRNIKKPTTQNNLSSMKVVSWTEGDLVWARVSGYPYWPGIVVAEPNRRRFIKDGKVHVQFYGDKGSHCFLEQTRVRHFDKNDQLEKHKMGLTIRKSLWNKWVSACSEADASDTLSRERRIKGLSRYSMVEDEAAQIEEEDEDAKFENEDLSGDDEDDDDDDDDDTWSITTGRNIYTFPRKSVSKQREISRYQRMISHLQNENIQEEYLHAMWGWISKDTGKKFDSKVDAKCERSCHEI